MEIDESKREITLRVEIQPTAKPPAKFSWHIGPVELRPGPAVSIQSSRTSSELRIQLETLTETTFTVKAENQAGIAYSYLTVKPGRRAPVEERPQAPKIIAQLREEISSEELRTVRIDARGHPPPQFTWYLDGVRVVPGERPTVTVRTTQTTSELQILSTDVTKETVVSVIAQNTSGVLESRLVLRPRPILAPAPIQRREITEEIEVERISRRPEMVAPKVTRHLFDQTVGKEESVDLTVEVEAQPQSTPEFVWFVNDLEIRPSATVQILQPTLYQSILRLIRPTLPRAEYKVEIRNQIGRTMTKCTLTVQRTLIG